MLISGRVSAGKTTLCRQLAGRFGAHHLKTKEVIIGLAKKLQLERGALQRYGETLDRRTNGAWVCEALSRQIENLPSDAVIVVDSVRIIPQIEAIRRAYGTRVVFHIHLDAQPEILAQRYARKQRQKGFREFNSYSFLSASRTERHVGELASVADVVISTDRCTNDDVLARAAAHVGLYGRECQRLADVLIGGEFGSEGKGHISSYLAPEYDVLVRVGGPNAGHKVFEDPEPYTHHQLPSGTRCSTARLIIGPGAVLSVPKLLQEIADCRVSANRLSIDPQAMIIEDADCRREARTLVGRIGSTGQGVGYATARKVMRGALTPPVRLAKDIRSLKPFLGDCREQLERAFSQGQRVFLEGTYSGFPFITAATWSSSFLLAL